MYDEFVRLTYNVTDVYGKTRLIRNETYSNVGYFELDGQKIDHTTLEVDSATASYAGTQMTYKWYAYTFDKPGVHTVSLLCKSYRLSNQLVNDCDALREIVLPSCVTDLGQFLTSCYSLQVITCYATTPPSTNNKSFFGLRNGGTLYVPKQSIDAYKETWLSLDNGKETLGTHNWEIKPILE